jgi:hypothetical protein
MEEHRLTVLRRVFGPKRDEVTGGWRKVHNEDSSPNIIMVIKSRRIRWAGVGKPEGKK